MALTIHTCCFACWGVNPSKGCYGSAVVCMFCGHFVVKAPNVQVILAKSKKPQKPKKNKKKRKKQKKRKYRKKQKNRKKQISETLAQVTAHSESSGKLFFFFFLVFSFFFFFCFFVFFFSVFFVFLFFLVFGFCQYYLYARSFDHKMTAKHANNCTPRVARSVNKIP